MSKKRFVEFYLKAMLKAATGGEVTDLVYTYEEPLETVRISFEGVTHKTVNVTGGSLLAIAVDVIQAVV